MTSESLLFFLISLFATGIFMGYMLNKLEKIYDKATRNITQEPQNVAEIKEAVEQMQLEHIEIAEVMEMMFKKLEDVDATQSDLYARFAKQFPGSGTKQTQQVLNIAAKR